MAVVSWATAATMPAMPTVKEVHQRAQRQQEEGQRAHQMGPVLGEQEESGHREEAEEDPGKSGASLGACAAARCATAVIVLHGDGASSKCRKSVGRGRIRHALHHHFHHHLHHLRASVHGLLTLGHVATHA